MAQGAPPSEIAVDFSAAYGIPVQAALRDVQKLLDEWIPAGLLVHGDGEDKTSAAPMPSADWAARPEPAWSAEWACTIAGRRVHFAIEPSTLAQQVRTLFQHVETPVGKADLRLELRSTGTDEYAVLADGREEVRTADLGLITGRLYQSVLQFLHPHVDWCALVHAGAVSYRGAGLAIPAPSGSGKSTLVAYLSTVGFQYLADDLVAIAAPGNSIVPWPMPISIKSGSWDVISRVRPELEDAPTYPTKALQARLLAPPGEAWLAEQVPLRVVVFPRFQASARAELIRLDPIEALARLLSDRIWLGFPLTQERVQRFLDLLGSTPAYSLRYGDLGEAAECIRSVLR